MEGGETCIMESSINLLVTSVIKSRRVRWVEHVASMEEINPHNILDGKPNVRKPLRRPRHIWEENIESIFGKQCLKL